MVGLPIAIGAYPKNPNGLLVASGLAMVARSATTTTNQFGAWPKLLKPDVVGVPTRAGHSNDCPLGQRL